MPDILTRCPLTGKTIETGLDTETVRFDMLPDIPIPITCPHCEKEHFWKPTNAWVRRPERKGRDTGDQPIANRSIWFVSYVPNSERSSDRVFRRVTKRFLSESDAKTFAIARLADATKLTAGTINPHVPKRVVGSAEILDWLDE
jgi:hypothetical protein